MRVIGAVIAAATLVAAPVVAQPVDPWGADDTDVDAPHVSARELLAAAEPLVRTGHPPDPMRELHLELSIGSLVGQFRAGDVIGRAFGFHASAGPRRDHLAVLADYSLLAFTEGDEPERAAMIHRGGVAVRYSVHTDDVERFFREELWLEAGVGREWLRWHDGGRLVRNDMRFAVATQLTFRSGGTGDHHKLGLY